MSRRFRLTPEGGALVPPGSPVPGPRTLPPGSVIGDGVRFGKAVTVGAFSRIGNGVRFGPDCVIGHHSTIGAKVVFEGGCRIGETSVVGPDATFSTDARLMREVVVGPRATFGAQAVLLTDCVLLPGVTLPATAEIVGRVLTAVEVALQMPEVRDVPLSPPRAEAAHKAVKDAARGVPTVAGMARPLRKKNPRKIPTHVERPGSVDRERYRNTAFDEAALADLLRELGADRSLRGYVRLPVGDYPAGARLPHKLIIPKGCRFGRDTTIGPDAVIHDWCVFNHGTIIGNRARIGKHCLFGRTQFGDDTKIGAETRWHKRSTFGERCSYYGDGKIRRITQLLT